MYDNVTTITYWIGLIGREKQSLQLTANPWLYALVSSSLVGLSGLFPVFLLKIGKSSPGALRFMLSFACGGLLGDVFLHLLPEAYQKLYAKEGPVSHRDHTVLGLWILAGILTFIVIEKMCGGGDRDENENRHIKISGYLNLMANCVDNFAHGLAVGGAFLVDNKTGFVTTACILCHEIPHEIGDFAILMNSGFTAADAARAQVSTAALGVMGSMAALTLNSLTELDNLTSWIIPFTSGGFLHIALVTVLPDLLKPGPGATATASDGVTVLTGIALGLSAMLAVSQF